MAECRNYAKRDQTQRETNEWNEKAHDMEPILILFIYFNFVRLIFLFIAVRSFLYFTFSRNWSWFRCCYWLFFQLRCYIHFPTPLAISQRTDSRPFHLTFHLTVFFPTLHIPSHSHSFVSIRFRSFSLGC